jgi:hypothetical protein
MDRPFPNIFSAQAAQAAQPPGEDEWVSGLRCQVPQKIRWTTLPFLEGWKMSFQ